MDAKLQWFREGLEGLSVQELKDMLVEEHAKRMQEHEERIREHEERMRENMRLLEFERSSAAMSREYQRILDKLAAAEKELSKSRALCKKLQEQNESLTKHRFGRHSEKRMSSLKALMTLMKTPWLKNICRSLKDGPHRR